jgi:pimeloyl-ACP methyl ester carboxylesterase
MGLPAVDGEPGRDDCRVVQQLSGWARRGWTIGEDLADTAGATIGFARSLRSDRQGGGVLRQVGLIAAAAVDGLLLATFRQLRAPSSDETFGAPLAEASALIEYLDRNGVFVLPETYHRAPSAAAIEAVTRRVGRTRFGHATYPSPYRPPSDVPGALRFETETDNHIVHAWLLRQTVRAPWVVCLHGAGMGDPLADMVAFRAARLHRCGFNVAIPVLPHHGPRGAGRFEVAFPGEDPTKNFHAAAQAIADVRALLAYIDSCHERSVLFGISLGAYVAAAVAALEPTLAGVIVGVPVVDIADLMRTHAPPRFTRHPAFSEFCATAAKLDAVTSALGLPPPDDSLPKRIWAGRADRLVRPAQVERLAAHWGGPAVCWYSGGHMGFLTARSVHDYIAQSLVDAGIADRRTGRLTAVA